MDIFKKLPNPKLADGPFSLECKEKGLEDFHSALHWMWQLPYGRNSDRTNCSLIFSENKGACSTKHTALYHLAKECGLKAQLVMVICKLNEKVDPRCKPILEKASKDYFPEAHTYISINDVELDITFKDQDPNPKSIILKKYFLTPSELENSKESLHQNYLKDWIEQNNLNFSLSDLWDLRESWIKILNKKETV